jgi:hypothetical protein
MNIAWAISENLHLPPKYSTQQLHDIAPIWSSWRAWRAYQSDNCVASNQTEIEFCIQHQYYQHCNLYLPDSYDLRISAPIRRYSGSGHMARPGLDDVIALHLAAAHQDLILLLGFDCHDTLRSVIKQYHKCQWVLVGLDQILDADIVEDNFTCDNLDNVLQSLST